MPTDTEQPKYRRLADSLRSRMKSGELKAGDRLPSFVQMYRDHGATETTMRRVYELLENEKLIERRGGSGVYVAEAGTRLTGNIGFIGAAFVRHRKFPFEMHLVEGVQRITEATQQHLLYLGTDHSLNLQGFNKVDGVLICNIENTSEILRTLPPNLPCVSLLNVTEGMTSVVADDYLGAKMATRHLASLGHQRIACLMEKLPSVPRRRFAGYSDALAELGIEADCRWARLTETPPKSQDVNVYREWGQRHIRDWLREDWEELNCTAIFVQNERAAIGVMQVLQEEGIKVPEEISVMGFDGTELCDYAIPRLSAVKVPLEQIGAKAMEILNQQIAGLISEAQTITLPVSLHQGGSVAPLRSLSKAEVAVL